MFSCRAPLLDLRIVARHAPRLVFAVRWVKAPDGVAQPRVRKLDHFAWA